MKWYYENIPEKGVLCKTKKGNIHAITELYGKYLVKTQSGNVMCYSELTPITAEEWWDFAPWKDIETAPAFETIVAMDDLGKTFPTAFTDEEEIPRSHYKKWLPLPKGDL